MTAFYSFGGGLFFVAVFAFFAGVNCARYRDWRTALEIWATIPPVLICTVAALWIGERYPSANFQENQGFGPEWECSNLSKVRGSLCFRDLPASLRGKPTVADRAGNTAVSH